MDAPDADLDIKLQKISADFIADFDRFLPSFLRKPDGHGGVRVRSRVRLREVAWLTTTILDPFQELPQLLDPHLPRWIPALSDAFLEHLQSGRVDRHKADSSGLLVSVEYAICRILYTFCKIRGDKVIVRFLNVETKHLELLLNAIEAAEQRDGEADGSRKWQWEQRYVVLLWLSHLLLAPFDLSTISSADFDEDASFQEVPGLKLSSDLPGIARRVIPLAVKYLGSPGKERDGAKALLVRIAMRRDMQQLGVLDSLVSWATVSLRPRPDNEIVSSHFYLGILSFIAGLLRSSSDTSDLESYLPSIFHAVHSISIDGTEVSKAIISFALVRKIILKIIRSVVVSMLRKNAQDPASTELTETAIGYLLECVSDNDTPVRFAASKSLSIITLKLEPEMASQVVEAVLESLNRNVLWKKASHSSSSKLTRDLSAVDNQEWHGLMLTLSHLLYRRSPPPEQLSDIIHALLLGLSFEQRSTSGTSVGSNVRDAACFGIWALARRYTTQELLAVPTTSVFAAKAHPKTDSILQVLGTELVTTASLDPAGNIRRGASAALQELIGRHPDTVENGIWVVQAVDYHAVARRSRAMEEVAFNATKLSNQYAEALLDGILGWRGVGDVDVASRRVAGATFGTIAAELAKVVPKDYVPMMETSLQHVNDCLQILQSRQVEERHGLLLCLSSLVDKFPDIARLAQSSDHNVTDFAQRILSSVSAILGDLQKSTYRRPELISEAASKLVISLVPVLHMAALGNKSPHELCSMQFLLSPDNQEGFSSLTSALDSKRIQNEDVDALLRALGHVVPSWLSRHEEDTVDSAAAAALVLLLFSTSDQRAAILSNWAEIVRKKPSGSKSSHGEGYFYSLAMAQPLVDNTGGDFVCQAILERWDAEYEIDMKVAILRSLTRSHLLREKPMLFLDLLATGLNDYTTTARGDVGSHVRVQALKAVHSLWQNINSGDSTEWIAASVKALFYNTLRLSAEKLDRIRPNAQVAISVLLKESYGKQFWALTFSSKEYFNTLLNLIHSDLLHPTVAEVAKTNTEGWMAELMAGFVTSADTGNEDLVIASRAALTDFCEASAENRDLVCSALLQNLKTRHGEDRFIVPTMEIIAFLFHVGIFQRCQGINLRSMCLQVQKAGYKTGNVRKIAACVKVYGGVASMATEELPGVLEARKRLAALLLHPWPKVRVIVVDEIWGLLGEEEEASGDKLTGIDWGKAEKSQIRSVATELRLE